MRRGGATGLGDVAEGSEDSGGSETGRRGEAPEGGGGAGERLVLLLVGDDTGVLEGEVMGDVTGVRWPLVGEPDGVA